MFNTKVNIGNSSFLVKFKKYKEEDNFISKKFIFIRKYYVMNNIIYDTEIYVLDTEIASKVINDINNNENELTDTIVFPYLDNKKSYYSNNYKNFNSSFNKNRFVLNKENTFEHTDLYKVVDKNNDMIFIPCNEIRVYHPMSLINLKSIIHVDAYYNNIHFHFYCNKYNNHEKLVDDEIKSENNIYSEYVKFYIPDIERLFFENYEDDIPDYKNTYFYDDLSLSEIIDNDDNSLIKGKIIEIDNKKLLPLKLLITPFKIEQLVFPGYEDIVLYKKQYVDVLKTIDNNYITSPVNLTIYPYKEIDESNSLYILDDRYDASTVTFFKGYHFKLSAKLGFDENGYCSIINKFIYENSDIYNIKEAYSLYNNVTIEDYNKAKSKLYRKYYRRAKYKVLNKDNENIINPLIDKTSGLEIGKPSNFDTYEEKYKGIERPLTEQEAEIARNEDYILDLETNSDDEMYNENTIKLMGYKLEISNDLDFKSIIYTLNVEQDFIDDFSFNINNIFDSWDNMPDILVARCIFIDKYLGKVISSNRITITKEWFKYLVNNDFYNADKIPFVRVNINNAYLGEDNNSIVIKNHKDENDISVVKNNLIEKDYMNVVNGFNFIDKINCTIRKEADEKGVKDNNLGQTKIFYKPIFFRVRDLQNIELKSNIVQNIGVNLSDYMAKVDGFKLTIENNMFKEISRNDFYVIFSINTNLIEKTEGRYVITNEEDEYISDGKYIIY